MLCTDLPKDYINKQIRMSFFHMSRISFGALFIYLSNNRILDSSKLKAFADDKKIKVLKNDDF